MQYVRITSGPAMKWNQEVEPVQPVQTNIYQHNTYRKDFSWLYFDDEARVKEWEQVKRQQSYIFVSTWQQYSMQGHIVDL